MHSADGFMAYLSGVPYCDNIGPCIEIEIRCYYGQSLVGGNIVLWTMHGSEMQSTNGKSIKMHNITK